MKGKLIKGIYNWTFLLVMTGVVIIVNVISSYKYVRLDMTDDQRFSLAPSTIEFLEDTDKLKGRINLRIYLEGKLPADLSNFRDALEDKLKEFKQYAGDRIEYQFIDPHVGTDEEKNETYANLFDQGRGILPMDVVYMKDGSQSQMLIWPGAVIDYGGSDVQTIQFLPGSKTGEPFQLNGMSDLIQNSINNLEYILVSSLRRATQEYKPRIGFLQGHGELKFQDTQRARALISPYFSITDVELNDSIGSLDDIDGLVIARPTKPFSNKDLYLIDQFVMKGGRLMCFMDQLHVNKDTLMRRGQTHSTRYNLQLDKLLFDYGLKLNDNLIMDVRCAPKRVPLENQSLIPWFFHILGTPSDHPISRNLEPVSLEYVSEVQFVQNSETVALSPVLTSSSNSTVTGLAPLVNLLLPTTYGKNPQLVPNPESETNKKCIAGLAEGTFDSYFKNRLVSEFADNPDSKFLERSTKEGKVLVVGNGRFIQNRYDSMPDPQRPGVFRYRPKALNDLQYSEEMARLNMQHYFGNQEFFQNLTDYIMGDNSVLDIRSRQIDIHEIDKEKIKRDANFYKLLNVGLPIGIILLLAFVMNFLRKRKYAR